MMEPRTQKNQEQQQQTNEYIKNERADETLWKNCFDHETAFFSFISFLLMYSADLLYSDCRFASLQIQYSCYVVAGRYFVVVAFSCAM